MDLLDAVLVDNPELDERMEDYLDELDSYAEPYVYCVKCEADHMERLIELVKTSTDVDSKCLYQLDNERVVFLIEHSKTDSKILPVTLMNKGEDLGFTMTISVFHHNPLGSIWETIDWGLQLLIEAEQGTESVLFNDFHDDNWPGIDKYEYY